MDAQLQHPAPLPRPRVGSRASAVDSSDATTTGTLVNRNNRLSSDSMHPPSIPISASTPNCCTGDTDQDDALESRPSRSTSSASRSNRLSLTLPIAPPNAFPTRPMPSSSTAPSFPSTPVDIPSALASPSEPADFITAIAAQERRVLEIREELSRAEGHLSKLKKQFQSHEVQRKRAEIRRAEQLRALSGKPPMASPATLIDAMPLSAATTDSSAADSADSAESKRSAELDRRKALLLQQAGSGLSTPIQSSKRRVFTGGRHTRALSLLSPTKTEGFNVLEDQIEIDAVRSPAPSQESDSPFCQNLGRYAPMAASQLPKRASWAPQSVHQASGLKQVAGDLTATLWTFVEDLRQATVGDEPINGRSSAMRNIDSNMRTFYSADGEQHTIRASSHATARPNASRAFDVDRQASPTPSSRNSGSFDHKSRDNGGSTNGTNGTNGTKLSRSGSKKSAKRFSWTPLTMDSYDDSEWSSWDSPTTTVNAKSPRWSGSTMGGDTATTIPEQADENMTPLMINASTSSPPTPSKGNELAWPTALNQLVPGNIKRMGTDLIKELEKGLAIAVEPGMVGDVGHDAHA